MSKCICKSVVCEPKCLRVPEPAGGPEQSLLINQNGSVQMQTASLIGAAAVSKNAANGDVLFCFYFSPQ